MVRPDERLDAWPPEAPVALPDQRPADEPRWARIAWDAWDDVPRGAAACAALLQQADADARKLADRERDVRVPDAHHRSGHRAARALEAVPYTQAADRFAERSCAVAEPLGPLALRESQRRERQVEPEVLPGVQQPQPRF